MSNPQHTSDTSTSGTTDSPHQHLPGDFEIHHETTPDAPPQATPTHHPPTTPSPNLRTTLSPQKLQANRLNAQKSTGPRSPNGKSRSALNAQTHGLRSRLDPHTLVPKTDHHAYADFLEDLRDNLDPASPLEELLVERIALLGWKLRRHAQAEARVLDQANRRAREHVERANRHATKKYQDQLAHDQRYNKKQTPPPPDLQPLPDPEPAAHLLARFAEDPSPSGPATAPGAHSLELLSRYESATERAFYKALQQYRALRTPPPPPTPDHDLHHHFHYHRHTDTQSIAHPSPPPNRDKSPNEPTDSAITPPTTTTNLNSGPSGTAPPLVVASEVAPPPAGLLR